MSLERPPKTSWWSNFKEAIGPLFAWWPEYRKSKIGLVGIALVIIMVFMILAAPVLATHDPFEEDERPGWKGGNYWTSYWTQEGSVSITTEGIPHNYNPDNEEEEHHAVFETGQAFISRRVNLSNPQDENSRLQFYAKAVDFEDGDEVVCSYSLDNGVTWIPFENVSWQNGDDDGEYHEFDIALKDLHQSAQLFWMKWESNITSTDAKFYLDDIMVLMVAPQVSPKEGFEPYPHRFEAPSWQHIMGTTSTSQDVWSRTLWSGRNSLMIGFVAAFLITSIGSALGMISGYFGGVIEELVMRLADILLIIPRLPLLIVLSAYLDPGPWTVIMLLTVTGWAGIARSTRAQTLSVKQHSYVEASRSVGASNARIIIQHILPNVAGIIIAAFAMEVVVAILVESGLSFLGLGDLTKPTWGVMLHYARSDMAFSNGAWWWIVPPGLFIALLGLAFAYIGNTLNDRFVLRLGSRRKG